MFLLGYCTWRPQYASYLCSSAILLLDFCCLRTRSHDFGISRSFGRSKESTGTKNFVISFVDSIRQTHDAQAPWPNNQPPKAPLPLASLVTVIQLAHVCGLLGFINIFVLGAARRHLNRVPELQEKVVGALLTPLVFGDLLHIGITLWALGDDKWDTSRWTPLLWATVVLGLTLFVPRVAWHLGIGRYVHKRDGLKAKVS